MSARLQNSTTDTRQRVLLFGLIQGLFAAFLCSASPAFAAAPTLTTTRVYEDTVIKSSVLETTAKLGATITSDGGGAGISARGIVWNECSINGDPLISDSNVFPISGTTTGEFSDTVTPLPGATQICFKGYATNGPDTGYSPVQSFYTELPAGTAPTFSTVDYFQMTVNYIIPDSTTHGADSGVVVVIQQGDVNHTDISKPPYDGTEYTPYSGTVRMADADATDPACFTWCAAVVATDASVPGGGSNSIIVTGLKEGYTYHAAVFPYKGTGTGLNGINYNQTVNSASQTTTSLSAAQSSHNELYVAGTYDTTAGTWTPAPMTSDLCTTCHAGHHSSSDFMPRGTVQYDKCLTCHNSGGIAAAKSDIALHNGGAIDCGSCHSLHSFKTEELYSKNHSGSWDFNQDYIRANMSKYYGTALDNTVFQAKPADYAYSVSDDDPDRPGMYNAVCQTCHTDDAKTLYHQQDSTTGHSVGVACTACHPHQTTDSSNAFFPTGGHSDTDFGWNAATDNCQNCHGAGAAAEAVVQDIHANNCDLCHAGSVYNASTNGAGPAADGVDGDAGLAEGAASTTPTFDSTLFYCTTCHDPAGTNVDATSIGGIHHNNKTDGILDTATASTTCEKCHTAVDHTSMIKDSPADCNSCHGNTAAATGVNPPISSAQGDPKVHDDCTTCHQFAATGYNGMLIPVSSLTRGIVYAMPEGAGFGGTDGGGDCANCHDATAKKSLHHGSTLATGGTCQYCHVNSQTTGVGATAPQQMACKECHVDETQNGLKIVSLRLAKGDGTQPTTLENANSAIDGSLSAGLVTDASGYVTAHDITHTSPIAINDYRSCFACHNGSYSGAAAVAPFHGYPGEASSGYIESGKGLFTNKTMIGGGTAQLDEVSGSNNLLPLAFMYYHPGHNSFRRFGETRTMTRRASNGSYTENGELYRSGGTYVNAIRSNAYNAGRVENYVRKAGNNYPGGECTHGGGNAWNTGTNLDISCTERKVGSNPFAGEGHETPVTGFAQRIVNIPFTNFSASDGNAPAGTGYGNLTNVPYFTAVGAPNDRVFVNSAVVDGGGALKVIALNDEGCGLLTVTTQPDNTDRGTMTLNGTTGYCELTVASVSPIPTAVDVVSAGTGTPSVTNYPVSQ